MDNCSTPNSGHIPRRRLDYFDPFKIGSNHHEHANSTRIIHLEDSNRVLCPLCLQTKTALELAALDREDVYSYIQDWFEVLDQYPNKLILRHIILQILETVLSNIHLCVDNANDLHNYLRILKRIIKSHEVKDIEFTTTAKIFSKILCSFSKDNPIPLTSVWDLAQSMLDFVSTDLQLNKKNIALDEKSVNIVSGSFIVIQSYLAAIRLSSPFGISDMIFPLIDKGIFNNPENHHQGQRKCIDMMEKELILVVESFIEQSHIKLDDMYIDMMSNFYEALGEVVIIAQKFRRHAFQCHLSDKDFVYAAHTTMKLNNNIILKYGIKSFLRSMVVTYFEENFKLDNSLKDILDTSDSVETNHCNVIHYISTNQLTNRIIFYLMINYFALQTHSNYYMKSRVKKVLKLIDPVTLDIDRSPTLLTTVSYLASRIFPDGKLTDNLETYMKSLWMNLEIERANIVFCSEPFLFFWSCSNAYFKDRLNQESIMMLIDTIFSSKDLPRYLNNMIQDHGMKQMFKVYLEDNSKASDLMEQLIITSRSEEDQSSIKIQPILFKEISNMLIDSLYGKMFKFERNQTQDLVNKIDNIIHMLMNLIRRDKFFESSIEENLFNEICNIIRNLYILKNDEKTRLVLSYFNELITSMTNGGFSKCILTPLQNSVLSLMYNYLSSYKREDELAYSIAKLIIALDNLKNHSIHRLDEVLKPGEIYYINLILSKNEYLQMIALRLAKKILSDSPSMKVAISSAIVQMIASNPYILEDNLNLETFQYLIEIDEFKFNPLLDVMMDVIPPRISFEIETLRQNQENRPPSPAVSFMSSNSSFFQEENLTVEKILRQLNQEDRNDLNDVTCRIPKNIYAAQVVTDQHTSNFLENLSEWERVASDAIRVTSQDL